MTRTDSRPVPPMDALVNLAHFHREHEKYYALAPLRHAEAILRASQTLKDLADHWTRVAVRRPDRPKPYTGCEDINDTSAIETSGVLFLEGGGEPSELLTLKEDIRRRATADEQTGRWLDGAMTASWQSAGALVHVRAAGRSARRPAPDHPQQLAGRKHEPARGVRDATSGRHPRRGRPDARRYSGRSGRTESHAGLSVLRGDAARPGRRPGGHLDDVDSRQRTGVAGVASARRDRA